MLSRRVLDAITGSLRREQTEGINYGGSTTGEPFQRPGGSTTGGSFKPKPTGALGSHQMRIARMQPAVRVRDTCPFSPVTLVQHAPAGELRSHALDLHAFQGKTEDATQ